MSLPASPLAFFKLLNWIDGTPLLDTMEPYRQRLHMERLYTFEPDRRRLYTSALDGRGKKNHKSTDLVLTALYFLLVPESVQGNDCIIVANSEDQANDDLSLAKKIVQASPGIAAELDSQAKQILRTDGRGSLRIVPARDATALHGKGYIFLGIDEMHGYRSYDVLEALAPDPHRVDCFTLIASYASIFNSPGYPLFDYCQRGKAGTDPRMHFSWYSSEYCTDPDFRDQPPEERANPSMGSWKDPNYLAQQKQRLPTHKYRRLHLNLPGMLDGAYLQPEAVDAVIVQGRRALVPVLRIGGIKPAYVGFVDMSGGSQDDAVLGIAHFDPEAKRSILDLLEAQTQRPPFDPMLAVNKFAGFLKQYDCAYVTGDNYAGQTFAAAFRKHGIDWLSSERTRSEIYESFEPLLNGRQLELLDEPKLQEQLLGLVLRGGRIDHLSGEHDDYANAACGALVLAAGLPLEAPGTVATQCRTDYDPWSDEHRRRA